MVVTYTAPCPQCGQDVLWTQQNSNDGWKTDPMTAQVACRCSAALVA